MTDYCKGGELFFHLKRVRTFNETLTRFYAAELVLAISHLHSQNMHPQLYASSDVRERSLSQTNIQLIQDENGFAVLMMGLLRGCMIRLLAKTAPPGC